MDQPVNTNIVPIENLSEEVKSEVPKEEYNKNLERDLVQFLEEEFAENTNGEFWKYVRDFANGKLGADSTTTTTTVMTDDQAKKFAQQEIPWGQFSGTRVETILKRNPDYLIRLAKNPLPFQKQLQRFLMSVKGEKKE